MVPLQDSYMQSRAEALHNVESTIHELSNIFNQLVTLVSQQGEVAIRIDENMDYTLANVEGAQGALRKYLNSISSNRWLMINIFFVLIFFLMVLLFFVANLNFAIRTWASLLREIQFGIGIHSIGGEYLWDICERNMVGGVGNRRDDGSLVIQNNNVFAALETLRKKKKDKSSKTHSSKSSSSGLRNGSQQQQVFWAPAPLKAKSWADVDDDEDDDYYATNAPPSSVWGKAASQQEQEQSHDVNDNNVEDTESDEDILDEGDEEIEEEHENESDVAQPEPVAKKSVEPTGASVVVKEADRQLSKKEKKKKELEELEALLADFAVAQKESNGQDESREALQENKDGELDGEVEKKDNAPGESKTSKKKKKKERSSKEAEDAQDQPKNTETLNGTVENAETEQRGEDVSSVNVKERLKKMASVKKKKPGKEVDSAARAAAQEAAARNAKLASAKKKEKSHYNQQPVR
ncbi:hypothetical protein MLD38_006147 [Melastoma candidum]|uniref:Uncharacterized protein n=1 Tax=Melastoma candidum TaxID=119954 RepID=A0ACB9RQP9_9MYRT|nr:hypothetical protein MLD38_006147 [Melastoma candidum]